MRHAIFEIFWGLAFPLLSISFVFTMIPRFQSKSKPATSLEYLSPKLFATSWFGLVHDLRANYHTCLFKTFAPVGYFDVIMSVKYSTESEYSFFILLNYQPFLLKTQRQIVQDCRWNTPSLQLYFPLPHINPEFYIHIYSNIYEDLYRINISNLYTYISNLKINTNYLDLYKGMLINKNECWRI